MTLHPIPNNEDDFNEIVKLITSSKERAYQAVNVLLIDLYWKIGGYISQKIKSAEWGDSVVRELASYPHHYDSTQLKRFHPIKFISHATIL